MAKVFPGTKVLTREKHKWSPTTQRLYPKLNSHKGTPRLFFLFLIYVFRGTGTSDRFIGIRVPSTFVATGPSLPRKTS